MTAGEVLLSDKSSIAVLAKKTILVRLISGKEKLVTHPKFWSPDSSSLPYSGQLRR